MEMIKHISRLLLLLAFSATAHGATTRSEMLLDAQGYRLDDPRYDDIRLWHEKEMNGVALFRTKEYPDAYAALAIAAKHGYKRAQQTLAIMHLNGHAVEKNLLVGVALLGLAAESGDRKLKRQFNEAVESLPPKFQPLVREQTAYYIARYGMQAQGVSCNLVKQLSSNLKKMRCIKQPGNYQVWDWAP